MLVGTPCQAGVANVDARPEPSLDLQIDLGVDPRELSQGKRLPHRRIAPEPLALVRRRRHQEGTQVESSGAQGAADARTRPADRKSEVSGELGIAQPALQVADVHRIGSDGDQASHRRVADVRQRRARQPRDQSHVLGLSFELHASRALTRADRTVGVQACALRADVEGERPAPGIVLKQPHRPAFDRECEVETRLQAAARGELQGPIFPGTAGQIVQMRRAAGCRARVEVVKIEPAQRDSGDVDRRRLRAGVTLRRRRPVPRPIGAAFEPQVDMVCLDTA
ncbi:MAG TPA: hypothetical protein PLE54_11825 [Burkholderiaceae bacterium]|nr:hypothetical protein [Burkholderiaceae bacterium]HQR71287.1 hypothetical protein [Burkholderiaceae bacterium]